ncbi:hypothetical protein [Succinivibrio dextrinosolvens]|uniref:hypothetical protein n=1 Tax=Succinivibrio dextrinosolvens TaxID=83771 RepID=UPI001921384A|nr:hypothetical protein [Succinivibrio dextrinosolvens]
MSKAEFKFFSVGQGLFHAGKICLDEKSSDFFTFIYDCGSVQRPFLVKSIDDCLAFFKGESKSISIKQIDFLFVSHLHKDHINGLNLLIDKLSQNHIKICNVVLPYVNLYQRVVLLLDALESKERSEDNSLNGRNHEYVDYIDFYKNPYTYIKKLIVKYDYSHDTNSFIYIVNAPTDCFTADKYIPFKQSEFENKIIQEDRKEYSVDNYESNSFQDESKFIINFEERDKNAIDNKDDFDFIFDDFYSLYDENKEKNSSFNYCKKAELKVATDFLRIIIKNTWRFICFNTPLPSEKKVYAQSLFKEFKKITHTNGKKFRISDIFLQGNINRLRVHYNKMFSDFNSTSLLIYHFPTNDFLRKHSAFLLLGDVNLKSSVIYKQSNRFNKRKSFVEFLYERISPFQVKNIEKDNLVNYVLAPHHGSDRSWTTDIFKILKEKSVYIFSSSVNAEKHPGIVFVKSFLNNKIMLKDKIPDELRILFLPYPYPIDDFNCLFKFDNYLLWCNEYQFFKIDIDGEISNVKSNSY